MAKKATLADFSVQKRPPAVSPAPEPAAEAPPKPANNRRHLKTKAMELRPEACRQFDVLRAETGTRGYELAAEALNLLFRKHGKPEIA